MTVNNIFTPDMSFERKMEIIKEFNEDAMFAEGFEKALVGMCFRFGQPVTALYDIDMCLQILSKDMSIEEADEFFSFNVLGAWVGESTPTFFRVLRDDVTF